MRIAKQDEHGQWQALAPESIHPVAASDLGANAAAPFVQKMRLTPEQAKARLLAAGISPTDQMIADLTSEDMGVHVTDKHSLNEWIRSGGNISKEDAEKKARANQADAGPTQVKIPYTRDTESGIRKPHVTEGQGYRTTTFQHDYERGQTYTQVNPSGRREGVDIAPGGIPTAAEERNLPISQGGTTTTIGQNLGPMEEMEVDGHSAHRRRGGILRRRSGGFVVGGIGAGDKPNPATGMPYQLEPGSFVLNRNAASAAGFARGGGIPNFTPTLLEKGEVVLPPGHPSIGAAMALNSAVPRFQSGGTVPNFQGGNIGGMVQAFSSTTASALGKVGQFQKYAADVTSHGFQNQIGETKQNTGAVFGVLQQSAQTAQATNAARGGLAGEAHQLTQIAQLQGITNILKRGGGTSKTFGGGTIKEASGLATKREYLEASAEGEYAKGREARWQKHGVDSQIDAIRQKFGGEQGIMKTGGVVAQRYQWLKGQSMRLGRVEQAASAAGDQRHEQLRDLDISQAGGVGPMLNRILSAIENIGGGGGILHCTIDSGRLVAEQGGGPWAVNAMVGNWPSPSTSSFSPSGGTGGTPAAGAGATPGTGAGGATPAAGAGATPGAGAGDPVAVPPDVATPGPDTAGSGVEQAPGYVTPQVAAFANKLLGSEDWKEVFYNNPSKIITVNQHKDGALKAIDKGISRADEKENTKVHDHLLAAREMVRGLQKGGFVKRQVGGTIPKMNFIQDLVSAIADQTVALQSTFTSQTSRLVAELVALNGLLAQGNSQREGLGNVMGQEGGGVGGRGNVEFDGEIDLRLVDGGAGQQNLDAVRARIDDVVQAIYNALSVSNPNAADHFASTAVFRDRGAI
jgi:hypothetical protein